MRLSLADLSIAAMLSLRLQRRHLRSTAVLTLIAWVLALLAGVVNACQLQTYTPGTLTQGVSTRGDSAERGMHAGQALHVEDGDHDAGRNVEVDAFQDRRRPTPGRSPCRWAAR